MNIALIFAGGTGKRYSEAAIPKQFLELHGKAIIVHAILPFQNHREIDGICVVCKSEWIAHFNALKDKYNLTKVKWVIEGGNTSQISVYRGLCSIRDSHHEDGGIIVLIHDGVRPLINQDIISRNIAGVRNYGNAITVSKVAETIVKVDKKMKVFDAVERNSCYHAKAPQGFFLKDIIALHERANQDGITAIDSASMMLHYGKTLHAIPGSSENIKITTPVDFFLYKAIYEARESSQIFGVGYES